MIKKMMVILLLLSFVQLNSMEKLDSRFCVSFGSSEAPIKVVQYFSFSCPQCMRTYQEDFKELRELYYGEVQWIFHPYPKDLLTIQSMACFEELNENQKRVLMEALCDLNFKTGGEVSIEHWGSFLDDYLSEEGREPFGLSEPSSITKTSAFHSAYQFVQQEDVIVEVPTVEVDGQLYDAFPNKEFLNKKLTEILSKRV
jgi:hypothetical protein